MIRFGIPGFPPVDPHGGVRVPPGPWRGLRLHRHACLHGLVCLCACGPVDSQPADLHGCFRVGLAPGVGFGFVDVIFFTFLGGISCWNGLTGRV